MSRYFVVISETELDTFLNDDFVELNEAIELAIEESNEQNVPVIIFEYEGEEVTWDEFLEIDREDKIIANPVFIFYDKKLFSGGFVIET